ncbi:MAG: hypothetical protein FWD59_04530 [Micrococcales bacterium]|nr:hypothetical protein [Micrococcales bacterium]
MKPALFAARRRAERPPAAIRPRRGAELPSKPPRTEREVAVGRALDRWRVELVSLGGPNALVDMAALGSTVLDLSSAHPSGIASLYAGRPTPLSNLVRDRTSLNAARASAAEVQMLAEEHAARYGLPPTHLSIGIAMWTDFVDVPPTSTKDDEGPSASATPSQASVEPARIVAPITVATTSAAPALVAEEEAPPRIEATVVPLASPTRAPLREPVARRVPILLRPIALGEDPREPDLTLDSVAEINPVLVRALRARGCVIDPEDLLAQAFTEVGFNPRPVLEHIEALGETVLADFRVRPKLIVGVFEHPGQILVEDLAQAGDMLANRTVIASLAGDPGARRVYSGQKLPVAIAADRAPDHERGIGDLTTGQQHILDVVAKGHSFFLDAAPGAPTAATLAAIIADTIGSGRSVLYVTGNRRASHAVVAGLRDAGLGEAILDLEPRPNWQRDAVQRLRDGLDVPAQSLDVAGIGQIRSALADRSRQIAEYIRALHGPRDPWNLSAYDAIQAIAQVTTERPGTRTSVRLSQETCHALQTSGLDVARRQISRLAAIGGLRLRREDTAWFGGRITDDATAIDLLERLDRLRDGTLAATLGHMREVAHQSGLATPTTLDGWGEQLNMLQGVREALDVFKPMVFERPPDDMVAATASAEWREEHGVDMSGSDRRRHRKQAKDMVRPGVVVADLHAALVHLKTQREVWMRHSPAVAWPKLPEAMAAIDAEFRAARADVDALSQVLRTKPGDVPLAAEPLEDLKLALDRLHATRSSLTFLPETTRLRGKLALAGLGALVKDLTARRAGLTPPKMDDDAPPGTPIPPLSEADQETADLAGFELDLAWWSSVLGFILAADKLLTTYSGEALAALVESYRELDLAHIATKPAPIRAAVASWRDEAARTYPGQTSTLASCQDSANLRALVGDCPDISLRSRPCWVAGPMIVPQALPLAEITKPVIDLVILDAASHVTIAQAAPALARGSQILVVGDLTRLGRPTVHAVAALAALLPRVVLQAPPASRDPRLTAFLAASGYASLAPPLPLPTRENLISFTHVHAVGQVLDGAANVESADAEVHAVVREVVAHVRLRSWESLAVISPSRAHVERIRYALEATAASVSELAAALSRDNLEPLEVVEISRAHGVQRDAICFTPGYAKTPHGHVLHDFGPLSADGGAGLLMDALLAARRRLLVVSALRSDDLTAERLRDPGPALFSKLLAFAEDPGHPAEPHSEEADALFSDFAERLTSRGFTVEARYGMDDGARVPLTISHPSLPERALVAILTDNVDFVREPSVRAQVRLRSTELERIGWKTVHAWSPAVFMDPEAEARTIAAIATKELEKLRPGISDC